MIRSKRLRREPDRALKTIVPGAVLPIGVAGVATALGHLLPIVGPPVFAIVGGICIAMVRPPTISAKPGLAFASRSVLQTSIVVLGLGLSFREVLDTGSASLPVLFGSLAVALLGARLIGKLLSIDSDLRTLIGVGTGICGASAIAATEAVISASESRRVLRDRHDLHIQRARGAHLPDARPSALPFAERLWSLGRNSDQ